jgi:hypothetical protein
MISQGSNGDAIDAIDTFNDLIIPEPFEGIKFADMAPLSPHHTARLPQNGTPSEPWR